jgi:8-oxo-dGTP pyrophosphatase MutT (NUDIX family)
VATKNDGARTYKRKVFAYVTSRDRLLVFRHPLEPSAGVQVPAGTVEPGEEPGAAVLREAWEETGLAGLRLAGFLGEREYVHFSLPEVHQRYFYHLVCEGDPPDTWQHREQDASDGSADQPFELFWAQLPRGVPELVAGHDALLPQLQRELESWYCSDTSG